MPERYRFRSSMPTDADRRSVLAYSPVVDDPSAEGVATIRIYDPIDSWGGPWGVSSKEFAAALAALPSGIHTINLHLNSPGGEVWEAIAIANQLRAHQARVVAHVDGIATSAASYLAVVADELHMGPQTQLMIHDAWGIEVGDSRDMRKMADLLDKVSDSYADAYATKAGGARDEWRTAMLAESWYSAEEAVAAGLADSVGVGVEPSGDVEQASASFDRSTFRYGSRDESPAPLIAARGGFPKRLRDRQDAIEKGHGLL